MVQTPVSAFPRGPREELGFLLSLLKPVSSVLNASGPAGSRGSHFGGTTLWSWYRGRRVSPFVPPPPIAGSEIALFLGFQGRAEGGYHALESVVGELRT